MLKTYQLFARLCQ